MIRRPPEILRVSHFLTDILINKLNCVYTEITMDTRIGMQYLQQHLHGLATKAGQFSATVHQQIA